MIDKVPPDTMEQLRKRASDLLSDLPQSAARGVDSVMRGAKASKDSLQRWARRHVALVTPVVNASGCLCHSAISGVPLSSESIEVAMEAFQAGSLCHPTAADRLSRRLSRCVPSGDWGVLIASSVDAACLAVANLDGHCPVYFHRSQSIRLASGAPIPDAFAAGSMSADHRFREVGAIGGVDAADLKGISGRVMLVAVDNGAGSVVWFRTLVESLPASTERTRVIYLPTASWTTADASQVSPALPAVVTALGRDADLVITPGDGVIGGPRCGLIIASKPLIEAIARSAVWPALVADPAIQAAMTLTLESICTQRSEDVPVQAMLNTHEENLRSRAERLATRISAEPTIRSCQITADTATIVPAGPWSLSSRQLSLTHRDLAASDWAARLLAEVPAVVVGVKDNAITVDLRWIQPSDDATLVATLVGHPAVAGPATTDPPAADDARADG